MQAALGGEADAKCGPPCRWLIDCCKAENERCQPFARWHAWCINWFVLCPTLRAYFFLPARSATTFRASDSTVSIFAGTPPLALLWWAASMNAKISVVSSGLTVGFFDRKNLAISMATPLYAM